jgi:hypothetical protein
MNRSAWQSLGICAISRRSPDPSTTTSGAHGDGSGLKLVAQYIEKWAGVLTHDGGVCRGSSMWLSLVLANFTRFRFWKRRSRECALGIR